MKEHVVQAKSSKTEFDVENTSTEIIKKTEQLVICGYPVRDLDRLMSFYLAAKNAGRYLVIDLKQAYLLKLFSGSAYFSKLYPAPTDSNIKIFIPRGTWSLIDKDLDKFLSRATLQRLWNMAKRIFGLSKCCRLS